MVSSRCYIIIPSHKLGGNLIMLEKKFKILDAETHLKELVIEFFINFIYGFLANAITLFFIQKNKPLIFTGLLSYYLMVSIIIRNKYITKLGKYVIFPVGAAIGGFSSYLIIN